jgi:hypothetical protein
VRLYGTPPFREGEGVIDDPLASPEDVGTGPGAVAFGPGTDAGFEMRNGHIWTIRDGMAVSLRAFPNPEEALEAAGLRQ